jgi:Tfp pilus assembly protein PilN
MRAVNLIPRDSRQGGISPSLGRLGGSHLLVALLAVALAFVTVYVLTANTVSKRKSQLAGLHQQVTRIQAQVTRLQSYEQFEKLAETRAQTVRTIAASRFDWHGALSDLSRVVPANTTLQSLTATVSPTTASGASTAGGSSGNVRGDINAPAFQLKGCTGSQDEVAQLMSRMRLINGVTRVTLEDSTKPNSGGAATTTSTATTTSSSVGAGCPANGPSFDMVVFFQPTAGAAATSGQTVSTSTTGAAK